MALDLMMESLHWRPLKVEKVDFAVQHQWNAYLLYLLVVILLVVIWVGFDVACWKATVRAKDHVRDCCCSDTRQFDIDSKQKVLKTDAI